MMGRAWQEEQKVVDQLHPQLEREREDHWCSALIPDGYFHLKEPT